MDSFCWKLPHVTAGRLGQESATCQKLLRLKLTRLCDKILISGGSHYLKYLTLTNW